MNKGFVIWLTGLPGSGKTTIAKHLKDTLIDRGLKVEVMDGDEVRSNLSFDLGFSRQDREIQAKRVTYVSKLLSRNGVVVIVALIAPYQSIREYARQEIDNYVEVYVKASLDECIRRDPKGLYKKALEGKINNLTGLQDPYEEPLSPDLIVNTEEEAVDISVSKILNTLETLEYLLPSSEYQIFAK